MWFAVLLIPPKRLVFFTPSTFELPYLTNLDGQIRSHTGRECMRNRQGKVRERPARKIWRELKHMYDYMNGSPGEHVVSRVKLRHHTTRSSVPTGRQGYGGDPCLNRAGKHDAHTHHDRVDRCASCCTCSFIAARMRRRIVSCETPYPAATVRSGSFCSRTRCSTVGHSEAGIP